MTDLIDRSEQYVGPDGFVDVKRLIAAYSFEEHAARADQYFKSVRDPWDFLLRKPFHDTDDTVRTLSSVATALRLAQIRPGHVVVDFGCGAGWLSMALAMMNCEPIGVDISAKALDLARMAAAEHPVLKSKALRFETLGESTLPLADASVDRIICFDSFHHVADQGAFLREFHRVLVPGGLVAFNEPGPKHSSAGHSQFEMREYAVIENDIIIEDIWATAKAAGFVDIRLAATPDEPIMLDLDTFAKGIRGKAGPRFYYNVGRAVLTQVTDKRMFSLRKAGATDANSRFADMLGARIALPRHSYDAATRRFEGVVELANTGGGLWLPGSGERGAVNLGARLLDADGVNVADLPRRAVSDGDVTPGEKRTLEVSYDLPAVAATMIEFDLVAENVGWFSDRGVATVRAPL